MNPSHSIPIEDHLKNNSLESIFKKVQLLKQLNICLKKILSPEFQSNTQVANYREETIVIFVDGSVGATRLLFESKKLLQALQHDPELPVPVSNIQVKVRPLESSE